MSIYLIFSAFAAVSTSLLACSRNSVLFFRYKLTSKYEIFAALIIQIAVFWVLTVRSVGDRYQLYPKVGGRMFLGNVGNDLK
jgi:hypothetical protein